MVKDPDRLYVDINDRELYKKMEQEDFFKGLTRKEQFLFAMAFGFINKVSNPIKTRENFFLTKDLKPDDEALMDSVALFKEKNIEILAKTEDVYKIAEEYAHAGIKLIVDKIGSVSFGNFWKQFEKELHESYDKLVKAEE